jgi:HAD superfamily hydrolase (TIGR01509 family)
MIRLVIFDIDGVIIDTKSLHVDALNKALKKHDEKYVISKEDEFRYNAIPTTEKLKLLTKERGLPEELHKKISKVKQRFTADGFRKCIDKKQVHKIRVMIQHLKEAGIEVCLASNARKSFVDMVVEAYGLKKLVKSVYSNSCVKKAKPNMEMYYKCMEDCGVSPKETIIIEDSKVGKQGAWKSGAYVVPVESAKHLTADLLHKYFERYETIERPYLSSNLTVVIPMAGAGSRFAAKGYKRPKPLIDVDGEPMIQAVVKNLNIDARFVFVCQEDHIKEYNLDILLPLIKPGCTIVPIKEMTEGAACTVALAENHVDPDSHLLIVNSDQLIDWDHDVLDEFVEKNVDGAIMTFEATDPKWSYARVGYNGFVCEVAEKNPISTNATSGHYYWKKASDFFGFTREMIRKNVRVNNEFYVCPVYNQAIEAGKKIVVSEVAAMYGLGTPEDLEEYLG